MASVSFVFALTILLSLIAKDVTSVVLEWPEECKDTPSQHYCRHKPPSYPNETWIDHLLPNMTKDYAGFRVRFRFPLQDVAKCETKQSYLSPIYVIKDDNDVIWYVPQTKKIGLNIETFECHNAGQVTDQSAVGLDSFKLVEKAVHCRERRVAFKFPVLSQDLSRLETVPISPKGGLPLSCSAKVIKKN